MKLDEFWNLKFPVYYLIQTSVPMRIISSEEENVNSSLFDALAAAQVQ